MKELTFEGLAGQRRRCRNAMPVEFSPWGTFVLNIPEVAAESVAGCRMEICGNRWHLMAFDDVSIKSGWDCWFCCCFAVFLLCSEKRMLKHAKFYE